MYRTKVTDNSLVFNITIELMFVQKHVYSQEHQLYYYYNIIFFNLLDSDWLKTVPINP